MIKMWSPEDDLSFWNWNVLIPKDFLYKIENDASVYKVYDAMNKVSISNT